MSEEVAKNEVKKINDKIFVWKLGNDEFPASDTDIKNFINLIDELYEKRNISIPSLVTNHRVELQIINI
jgi:hypothetical protein